MVEAGAKEVPRRRDGPGARARARGDQGDRRRASTRWRQQAGKTKRAARRRRRSPQEFYREVEGKVLGPLADAMRIKDKLENYATVDQVLDRPHRQHPRRRGRAEGATRRRSSRSLKEKVLRDEILERGKRLDGREVRRDPRRSRSKSGVLPRTHGSAVFTRGETQALVTATLGTADDQQKIETVDGETWKRFMLHYNFPPFSVGEVQFLRGPGRREIGHGALAERALAADDAGRRERSPTPSASSPTSSNRTARRRWPRSAAGRWR